ncbi:MULTISPECIES: DUF6489 family protein [Thalassolituus]|uniref:Uncharacterized protein n=1 Tax=Thalassolituus maritimus TaxID=484498 RepID=A0A1N7N289_9GAMM|nr:MULTISPECIES: DUF6489 family protein [Thalassolituus]MEC8908011.1 DUF6489 family protein [Pseudomonadota bacterium]TPD55069.1 MAG: hypothetical protein C9355_05265 [Thalassolituus maritimus]SIS92311.1 hypothetical protein SAMN05421686_106125 [Thalassolituus maritimus]
MKVNVTFDMTPEEFRRLLGLPDVQQFQADVFEQMMEKMKAGEDGYDPMSIYQPMMEKGMSAMTNFQQNLMSMMMAGQSKD